jgi:Xaa-Pro dipeptidase
VTGDEVYPRLRDALSEVGVEQALLSHPETVAHLTGFSLPVEDWPVANPFTADPPLLIVPDEGRPILVLADFYGAHVRAERDRVVAYRSYDFREPPDPSGELAAALEAALGEALVPGAPVGVEAGSLPLRVAEALHARGAELVDVSNAVVVARRVKSEPEIESIRRASRLADVVQQAVKDHAAAGLTEAEVAGLAQAAMYREAGRRVPAILTVTAGEATATGGGEATGRVIAQGDLVLTDTSPWLGGAWSDTANAVVVGTPTAEHRRIFDVVRGALELAIELCRPGAVAKDVDARVREALADLGPSYGHHTGHGIGASWSEEPRITPYNEMRIEEGMVLAVEPAVYRPGWGGIRLEHVFVVRASGNEVLTEFEHTL